MTDAQAQPSATKGDAAAAPAAQKVRISIRLKLAALIFLLITAALGAIAWQGLALLFTDKETYITAQNTQVATEIERQVRITVNSLQQRMVAFADTLDYAYADLEQRQNAIKARFKEFEGLAFIAVYYVDKDDSNFYFNGKELGKQGRTPESVKNEIAFGDILTAMGSERTLIANVTQKPTAPLIRFAVRAQTIPGNDVLVVGEMSQDELSSVGGGEEFYTAFLVDRDGRVLSHPDTTLLVSKVDLSELAVIKALRASELVGSVEYTDSAGEQMLAAHLPVARTGIGVIVQIPKKEVFAATRLIARRSGFIISVVGIVALFAAVFFAGTMAGPIRKLAAAADRVAAGDFDQKVTVKTRDEIGYLAATFNHMIDGLRERDRVKTAFGRYVSKQVAQKILSVEDELALAGESREVTVLFSDIRGFTAMSERLPARIVVNILNAYFRQMVDCVFRNDGSLDKYIGDAIMAVYGAPLAVEDKEWKAVKTAIDMMDELARLNAAFAKRGTGLQLHVGIGINTGEVIAGNIGSPERLEYTVIGDNVNVASRIEAETKPFNGGILISQSTLDKVKSRIRYEPLAPIKVKGKSEALQLYRVLGALETTTTASVRPDEGEIEFATIG